ncbi:hypothetical protein LIMNO130_50394 [Limnobacter sp. 130]|nr:hypothetical protein LIMNO130_50394 [Limnobacter sp. 130]
MKVKSAGWDNMSNAQQHPMSVN